MLEILRITVSLLLNNVEFGGGGAVFVSVYPIRLVTPSIILSTYYVASTRLGLEKIEVNKMLSLFKNNLQALSGGRQEI